MVFQLFPATEPLQLQGGKTGPLFGFFVPVGAAKTFIRVIALWRDNTPLVGRPPTFEIKSGRDGELTPVKADDRVAEIRGVKAEVVARARCQRLAGDSYLLTISDISDNAGPGWHLRITNNDAETLRFVWVSSHEEDTTFQPWMALEIPASSDDNQDGVMSLTSKGPEITIRVRNWGTKPLDINDPPGSPLGPADSPVVILRKTAQIAPHDVGEITVECGEVLFRRHLVHTFDADDALPAHRTLSFNVLPILGGGGFVPPPEDNFCRSCGRCQEYVPPPGPPGGRCQRGVCRHPAAHHFEVPPDHRNS